MIKWGVTIVANALSIGWILGAALCNLTDTAGRGGAVALALSLIFMFLSNNLGRRAYDVLSSNEKTADALVRAVIARLDVEAATIKSYNQHLAVSSGVGTMAWGFGDLLAKWFRGGIIMFHG